jgi:hypothetical protein
VPLNAANKIICEFGYIDVGIIVWKKGGGNALA